MDGVISEIAIEDVISGATGDGIIALPAGDGGLAGPRRSACRCPCRRPWNRPTVDWGWAPGFLRKEDRVDGSWNGAGSGIAGRQEVVTVVAGQGISTGPAVEGVIVRTAVERIVSRSADQQIVARFSDQDVVSDAAEQGVVAGPAVERVAARAGDQQIIAVESKAKYLKMYPARRRWRGRARRRHRWYRFRGPRSGCCFPALPITRLAPLPCLYKIVPARAHQRAGIVAAEDAVVAAPPDQDLHVRHDRIILPGFAAVGSSIRAPIVTEAVWSL